MTISIDTLSFDFPDDWQVQKYDDWVFCAHFRKLRDGIKASDLLAVPPDGQTLFVIEAKDFRQHPRQKTMELGEELVGKLLCTLAALLPARLSAVGNERERAHAALALGAQRIEVVFHIEPQPSSGLFPLQPDLANLKMKLAPKFKALGIRLHVVYTGAMSGLEWSVN